MTTENVQKQTDDFLAKAFKSYETLLPQMKEGEAKELAKNGFQLVKNEIERRAQKKTEEHPNRVRPELNPSLGIPALNETPEKLAADQAIKTIKAPTIEREPEYINIELTDQKGAKYIRTYNRAQVKALCRKYFSNVHNAWFGGNRKLTNGFENLLAYFLGWVEFDRKTPGLQDVLQDYKSYRKAKEDIEDSEAFKVAKELYEKIILITSK